MKKVLFITNIPSPYRVVFFEQLGKKCDLTVVFERRFSSDRDQSWKIDDFQNFKAIFCSGIDLGVDHAFSLMPIRQIKKIDADTIILANNMSPSGLIEVLYCKMKHIPFCIEGDGAFCSKSENALKKLIKTFAIKGAQKYYSTCINHDLYYEKYGAQKEKILRYPFSSVTDKEIYKVDAKEKARLRKELGIKEEKVIVSVGQFIYRKGFDVLAEAVRNLSGNVGVYLIGGNNLPFENDDYRIHAVGYKLPWERNQYFQAADLFVLPTREDIWGLVINEAMASGLPVITTDRCNAGLTMIKNNDNGFIVKANDGDMLSKRICDYFACTLNEQEMMSNNALQTTREWTVEKMVAAHRGDI